MSQADKGAVFAALHERGCFLIPNPWDAGSARMLEALGFPALATTSSGFAFTLGKRDGGVTLDELAAHVASLTAATDLPVSVDLEDGHGDAPNAIRHMAEAGAVGGSIEDWDRSGALLPVEAAAERVAAAAEVAHSLGFPFMLSARAENHIRGFPDLADTIARLQAYEAAGADVLYAPGLRTVVEIRAVCDALVRPVNVLALGGLSAAEIADAGARRISVGGGLTWLAVNALAEAATRIRDDGDFSVLTGRSPVLDDALRER